MLENKIYKAKLRCIFCKANLFELPFEGYQPISGDMIRCANCGKSNDYTSIRRSIINKTVETIKEDVHSEIINMFKKAGFRVK